MSKGGIGFGDEPVRVLHDEAIDEAIQAVEAEHAGRQGQTREVPIQPGLIQEELRPGTAETPLPHRIAQLEAQNQQLYGQLQQGERVLMEHRNAIGALQNQINQLSMGLAQQQARAMALGQSIAAHGPPQPGPFDRRKSIVETAEHFLMFLAGHDQLPGEAPPEMVEPETRMN